jgi:hypothetical protein
MARSPERLRQGAERGVAQVLTAAETLELLDRLQRAEVVAQAAVEWVEAHRTWDADAVQAAVSKLHAAVAVRTDPDRTSTPSA